MPSPVVLKFESAVELYRSHVDDCARCRAATLSPLDRRRSQCERGRRFSRLVDAARAELDEELVAFLSLLTLLSLFADVDDVPIPVGLTPRGAELVAGRDA